MASAEQHHQERGRIAVRGRDLRRLHNNMLGAVHSVSDGRTEEQQKNRKPDVMILYDNQAAAH